MGSRRFARLVDLCYACTAILRPVSTTTIAIPATPSCHAERRAAQACCADAEAITGRRRRQASGVHHGRHRDVGSGEFGGESTGDGGDEVASAQGLCDVASHTACQPRPSLHRARACGAYMGQTVRIWVRRSKDGQTSQRSIGRRTGGGESGIGWYDGQMWATE